MAPGQISRMEEIRFLAADQLRRGGFIPSAMFFVDGTWRSWVPIEEPGKLIEIQAWPAESFYWGDRPAEPTDIATVFLNVIAQHANLWTAWPAFSAIQDDLFNLGASIHKLGMIHMDGGQGSSRLAKSEVEYVMLLCRGVFDLLQEVLKAIWDTVSLTGPDGAVGPKVKKRQLRKSFSDMALRSDAVRPVAELIETFGLPQPLAECYGRHAPVFLKIRRFRDDIVHRGYDVQTLFHGEDDFLIQRRLGPFELAIWRPEEIEQNDLAPLKPALALLIHGTLAACEDFAETLTGCIRLPPQIVPGLTLYMRGYFNAALVAAIDDANARSVEGLVLIRPESDPDPDLQDQSSAD